MLTGMDAWLNLLLGGGTIGTPVLALVLSGRLIPVWVVRKQVEAAENAAKAAVAALEASHQRELTSQAQAHHDALEVRDREAERQSESLIYERGAKDVERSRSDALAGRLADIAAEYGAVGLKFQRAIREAASGEHES